MFRNSVNLWPRGLARQKQCTQALFLICLITRGGTGMKNQVLIGYRVFKYGSSRVRVHVKLFQKTLASLAKWSIDTTVWNMCLWQRQIFDGHRVFSIFIMWQASTQSILSLRLASTTADLIPYPFGSGIEEQIPVLPGRIQVPVPVLAHTALLNHRSYNGG